MSGGCVSAWSSRRREFLSAQPPAPASSPLPVAAARLTGLAWLSPEEGGHGWPVGGAGPEAGTLGGRAGEVRSDWAHSSAIAVPCPDASLNKVSSVRHASVWNLKGEVNGQTHRHGEQSGGGRGVGKGRLEGDRLAVTEPSQDVGARRTRGIWG